MSRGFIVRSFSKVLGKRVCAAASASETAAKAASASEALPRASKVGRYILRRKRRNPGRNKENPNKKKTEPGKIKARSMNLLKRLSNNVDPMVGSLDGPSVGLTQSPSVEQSVAHCLVSFRVSFELFNSSFIIHVLYISSLGW